MLQYITPLLINDCLSLKIAADIVLAVKLTNVTHFRCIVHILNSMWKDCKLVLEDFLKPLRTLVKKMRMSCKATHAASSHGPSEPTDEAAAASSVTTSGPTPFQDIVRLQYDCKTRFMSVFFMFVSLLKHKSAVIHAIHADESTLRTYYHSSVT